MGLMGPRVIDPVYRTPDASIGFARSPATSPERRLVEESLGHSEQPSCAAGAGLNEYASTCSTRPGSECQALELRAHERIKGYRPVSYTASIFPPASIRRGPGARRARQGLRAAVTAGTLREGGLARTQDGTRSGPTGSLLEASYEFTLIQYDVSF